MTHTRGHCRVQNIETHQQEQRTGVDELLAVVPDLQNLRIWVDRSGSSWRSEGSARPRCWWQSMFQTSTCPRTGWSSWCQPTQSCPDRWGQTRPRTMFELSQTNCKQTVCLANFMVKFVVFWVITRRRVVIIGIIIITTRRRVITKKITDFINIAGSLKSNFMVFMPCITYNQYINQLMHLIIYIHELL